MVLTYRGVITKMGLIVQIPGFDCHVQNPGIATVVDARMVKAKQAWKVLQGKLISLGL